MLKIIVNPNFEKYRNEIETLPFRFANEGKILYNARNQIRKIPISKELVLNVKRYRIPIFFNRLVYTYFRRPKAERAYENALRLLDMGIQTALPIAYILQKKNGLLSYSYLITEQLPYKHNMYEIGKGGIEGREDILTSFAYFSAILHIKGIYHKDYSPGNIIYDRINGNWYFAIIDINRMKFCEISMKDGCKNFARLWGRKQTIEYIATKYAEARGYDVEKCKHLILKKWINFWKKRDSSGFDFDGIVNSEN